MRGLQQLSGSGSHLVRHSPQYIGHLLLLHDAEWENWGKLEQTIRTGQRAVDRHVFETDPYSRSMRVSARGVIELDSPGRHVLRRGHENFEVMPFDQLRLAEIEAEAWLRAGRDLVAVRKSTEAVSTW